MKTLGKLSMETCEHCKHLKRSHTDYEHTMTNEDSRCTAVLSVGVFFNSFCPCQATHEEWQKEYNAAIDASKS